MDAGITLGEQFDRYMVAVSIGPDVRLGVLGSPDYLCLDAASSCAALAILVEALRWRPGDA